jgi:hypothetical protein
MAADPFSFKAWRLPSAKIDMEAVEVSFEVGDDQKIIVNLSTHR